MKSTELERQQYALKCVKNQNKDYKSYIEKFGLLVYNNGLINAVVYTKSKNSVLYGHVKNWIRIENYLLGFETNNDTEGNDIFIHNLTKCKMEQLLAITQEVVRLADVLKLFAKAEL